MRRLKSHTSHTVPTPRMKAQAFHRWTFFFFATQVSHGSNARDESPSLSQVDNHQRTWWWWHLFVLAETTNIERKWIFIFASPAYIERKWIFIFASPAYSCTCEANALRAYFCIFEANAFASVKKVYLRLGMVSIFWRRLPHSAGTFTKRQTLPLFPQPSTRTPSQHMLAALAYYIWWTSKGKLLLFSLRSVGPWFTDPTWSA